jgi:hypothetical protein
VAGFLIPVPRPDIRFSYPRRFIGFFRAAGARLAAAMLIFQGFLGDDTVLIA